jgi:hypothetical protein
MASSHCGILEASAVRKWKSVKVCMFEGGESTLTAQLHHGPCGALHCPRKRAQFTDVAPTILVRNQAKDWLFVPLLFALHCTFPLRSCVPLFATEARWRLSILSLIGPQFTIQRRH